MFFNISTQELLVILLVALVVVGPQKLPELSRAIGRGMREFRRMQDEVKDMVKIDLNPEPPAVHQPGVSGPRPARPPHRSARPGGVGRIVDPASGDGSPEPAGVDDLPDVPDESVDGPAPAAPPAPAAADGERPAPAADDVGTRAGDPDVPRRDPEGPSAAASTG